MNRTVKRLLMTPVVAGLAALTLGGAAQAAPAEAAVPVKYDFVREYYWLDECNAAGLAGKGARTGEWSRYKCINGSSAPWDDYELWVVWN
jgi:hypothetical protein